MTSKELWKLHELDIYQARLEKQLKEDEMTEKLRRIKQVIISMQERVKTIKEAYDNLKLRGDILEQAMIDLNGEIKNVNKKLYDGKDTNFKELSAHTKQVEKLKTQLEDAEEEYLTLLEQRDELKDNYKTIKLELKTAQEEFKVLHKTYEDKRFNIKKALEDIPATRGQLINSVGENVWLKYLELKKKYPDPLSKVNKGICSGCHIALFVDELNKLKREIVFCSHCGRLLFPESGEENQSFGQL